MSRSNSKKPSTLDPNALLARIVELRKAQPDAPAGFFTAADWAAKLGVDSSKIYEYLQTAVDNGLMEVGKYRAKPGERPIKHFRQIK